MSSVCRDLASTRFTPPVSFCSASRLLCNFAIFIDDRVEMQNRGKIRWFDCEGARALVPSPTRLALLLRPRSTMATFPPPPPDSTSTSMYNTGHTSHASFAYLAIRALFLCVAQLVAARASLPLFLR